LTANWAYFKSGIILCNWKRIHCYKLWSADFKTQQVLTEISSTEMNVFFRYKWSLSVGNASKHVGNLFKLENSGDTTGRWYLWSIFVIKVFCVASSSKYQAPNLSTSTKQVLLQEIQEMFYQRNFLCLALHGYIFRLYLQLLATWYPSKKCSIEQISNPDKLLKGRFILNITPCKKILQFYNWNGFQWHFCHTKNTTVEPQDIHEQNKAIVEKSMLYPQYSRIDARMSIKNYFSSRHKIRPREDRLFPHTCIVGNIAMTKYPRVWWSRHVSSSERTTGAAWKMHNRAPKCIQHDFSLKYRSIWRSEVSFKKVHRTDKRDNMC